MRLARPGDSGRMDLPGEASYAAPAMAHGATTAEEIDLLRSVIDERPGAWDEFYRRYHRLVIACIRKVLNRYSVSHLQQDLDDLLNHACLEIIRDDYKKLRAFDPGRGYKLSSWIGLIATNATHDVLRRRRPSTASVEELNLVEAPDTASASPLDAAILRQQQDALNRAVEHLSPGERAFLRYYYQEGLEPAQIAEVLGISVNTVYSRKNKVRTHLIKIMSKFDIKSL